MSPGFSLRRDFKLLHDLSDLVMILLLGAVYGIGFSVEGLRCKV